MSQPSCSKSIKKLQNKIQKIMQSYSYGDLELKEIAKLFKNCPISNILYAVWEETQFLNKLKWLTIVHYLITEKIRVNELSMILESVSTKRMKIINDCQQNEMLQKTLIIPYKLYLLKRLSIEDRSDDQKYEKEEQVYRLMNILQRHTTFIDKLFILGRYFVQKYTFIYHFNVVLAVDALYLYDILKSSLDLDFGMKVYKDIDKIHQCLYPLYYNCYMQPYVFKYCPLWINTDHLAVKEKQNNMKNCLKIHKKGSFSSEVSKKRSDEDTKDSAQFKNKNSLQRIELISSFQCFLRKMEEDYLEEVEI